ncbi:MAG: hypothetical protein R2939_13300 [Kofleriaceae bacterium]
MRSRPCAEPRGRWRRSLALALVVALTGSAGGAVAQPEPASGAGGDRAIAAYFDELERVGLIDVESGDKTTLARELATAEALLASGAAVEAAIALHGIVDSPRYAGLVDFVEYQNAEYDLAVALSVMGAYDSALDVIERILGRGPSAPYWGPAHRRAVDIALETRAHAAVLARLEAASAATAQTDPIPPSAAGERAYLRGRAAYDVGDLAATEGALVTVSRKSRLYSSALYLRGVVRARRGEYRGAAEAMCEVAGGADDDRFAFVVDERYFTIKDLARLGLGRIAHEQGEYDDAYYHYFQVPDDSDRLPEALFEAAWSMYQKRELATARDLVAEFLRSFPSSPLWPEASLLAGYVELADCKFDASQTWYDGLVARLGPVVAELDAVRQDPDRRRALFAQAITTWRQAKTADDETPRPEAAAADTPAAQVASLLRLDPAYVRLHDAVTGMARTAGEAPGAVRQWQALATAVAQTRVGTVAATTTMEEDAAAAAGEVAGDFAALADEVARARAELARGRRDGTVPAEVAADEERRLDALAAEVAAAHERAERAAEAAAAEVAAAAVPALRPMIERDITDARRIARAARDLQARLAATVDALAVAALDRLYATTRKVLDKAKLGKIDAVIGQKRKLDIDVQDLAAGRLPPELRGRLWQAGLIGDDEEFWPFEGEFWADEYEGWR